MKQEVKVNSEGLLSVIDLYESKVSKEQRRHLPKDQYKSDCANKFIGRGIGATGEYLRLWAEAKMPVNCGEYDGKDTVFISANGSRPGRQSPDFNEIRLAADAGADFLTDAKKRRPEGGNPYNVGEQEVADFLRELGYSEKEEFGGLVARWSKKAPKIEITDEFRELLDLCDNTNEHVYVNGKAGVGKSTFISYFMDNTKKRCVLLAPTGVAALNIGGQTVHRFFSFPPKLLTNAEIPYIRKQERLDLYHNVDTIIIDEIGMVRADMIDAVDMFLRINLSSGDPFAGKQVIMVGDIFQLSPVTKDRSELEWLRHRYVTEYFYSAAVWEQCGGFRYFELSKVFRQKDEKFISLLNKVRTNSLEKSDLRALNDACMDKKPSKDSIIICNVNSLADRINESKLNEIDSKAITLRATIEGKVGDNASPVKESFDVKIGAKVFVLVNYPNQGVVNGTMGFLREVNGDSITIEDASTGLNHVLGQYSYKNIAYEFDKESKSITSQVTGTFTCFPIKLGYASTVHKAQSLTFDKVVINIGAGGWTSPGMMYVALSRCRTLEGITLINPVKMDDVRVDPRLAEFIRQCENT
jgi:ATP-dependent DNA helicase PIF1